MILALVDRCATAGYLPFRASAHLDRTGKRASFPGIRGPGAFNPCSRRRRAPAAPGPKREGGAESPASAGPLPRPGGDRQTKNCAPLAEIVEPLMKAASSEARKATIRATSSGSPRRPAGICAMIFSRTASGTAITISVAM